MVSKANQTIEYMCSHCGQKVMRTATSGRPNPGTCPRRTGDRPHVWVVNRRIEH